MNAKFRSAVAFASLAAALAAGAATATSPGRNGLIAFASDRHPLLHHPQIFDMSAAGGRPRNLSASADADYDAAPSPNGKLIAFARWGANGGGIWLMNANGSGQRQLTSGGGHPVWSRDGRTIAYNGSGPGDCPPGASRCGHTVAVRIVRVDGSADRVLSPSSRNASWSPSGRRVAYEAAIDPYGQAHAIHVANADGTNVRQVAGGGATASPWAPAWSPGGSVIAYTVNRAIYVVRPDGTGRRRLAGGTSPLWTSDSARLAYLCGPAKPSGTFALCVVGTTGRGRRVIARDVHAAAWSPRGFRLAYARRDGIFVVNADGRGRKRLARKEQGVSIRSLGWSADGRRLVLAEGRDHNDLEIYTAESDGTHVKALTNDAVSELQPSWAPDGRQLAFVRMRGSLGDIWLMDASGRRQRLVVRLFTAAADGSGAKPLTPAAATDSLSWSPDSATLAFVGFPSGGTTPTGLYAIRADGSGLTHVVSNAGSPSFSPDGAALTFATLGQLGSQIEVSAADGSVRRVVLAARGRNVDPDWQPLP